MKNLIVGGVTRFNTTQGNVFFPNQTEGWKWPPINETRVNFTQSLNDTWIASLNESAGNHSLFPTYNETFFHNKSLPNDTVAVPFNFTAFQKDQNAEIELQFIDNIYFFSFWQQSTPV